MKGSIIEKKIKYDHSIVEYRCLPLKILDGREAILYHKIIQAFELPLKEHIINIPKGSYTVAFYWSDRPYNVYVFRNKKNQVIALYINIVKNTQISKKSIEFYDLILDIVVTPDGKFNVLDIDELTESLEEFENGEVYLTLKSLISSLSKIKNELINESEKILKYNRSR